MSRSLTIALLLLLLGACSMSPYTYDPTMESAAEHGRRARPRQRADQPGRDYPWMVNPRLSVQRSPTIAARNLSKTMEISPPLHGRFLSCRATANSSAGSQEVGMVKFLTRFLHDDSGATAIEYGLIAALIAVAIITAVGSVGSHLTSTFNSVASAL